jgi:dipeptidyl aminopeptidase/acylaminoacyl peptidase
MSPRWSPDGRALYFLSARDGSMQVHRLDLAGGGEARPVTRYPLDVGSFVVSPDGRSIALSFEVLPACGGDLACTKKAADDKAADKATGKLYDQLFVRHWDTWKDGHRSQLFVARLGADGTAEPKPALVSRDIDGDVPSKPFGDESEYAWSPDSASLVFGARIAGRTEPWSTNFDLYLAPADGSAAPRNLTAANPAWDAGPVFSADGRTLYYRAMKRPGFEADRFGVMAMDLRAGTVREVAPSWDRSADTLQLSRDGRTLYTTTHDLGHAPLFAIDVASGRAMRLVGEGTVSGFSVGADAIVLARDDLRSPAQLYRTGLRGGRLERLTDFNAQRLAQIGFGAAEQFTFAGHGGQTVYAWLVKPAGFDPAKKYPVAYLIHGGPQGSFGNQFHYRWNPQTYAGKGFAAIMVDFHGSTGYGQAFTDSISGDWGGKPLEDLDKGLEAALAKYPFLDGDRVCALGGSYGGFMTNWIAGMRPDRYRCLVSHAGVFDARMMSYATEEQWFDLWERKGTPFEKPENFERDNPVTLVGRWKTPMLVIHGQLDYRIPVEQGIATFTALQSRNIPSRFLYFPDENHWVLKPANSILWHDTVNAWLAQWLDAKP